MTGESESVQREKSKDLLVSVIIPVYQVSDYVERWLLSVMNQTYQNIECIIVDDCSTDDSIDKCERLIESYRGPIKYQILHHEWNRGLSAARNTGTNAATGNYLYYIDSDDYISKSCIELLAKYVLEDDSLEMVQGSHVRLFEGNEECKINGNLRISGNEKIQKLFYDKHAIQVYVWNKLLKRSFVVNNKLYCKEGIVYEDYLWTFFLLKHLQNAYLSGEVTYFYDIRQNSIMTNSKKESIGASLVIIYNDILDHLTIGKERAELHGNLFTFCKRYLTYLCDAPALSNTLNAYRESAKRFRCWFDYFILTIVHYTHNKSRLLSTFETLNRLRLVYK